jgi:hypothetical protein
MVLGVGCGVGSAAGPMDVDVVGTVLLVAVVVDVGATVDVVVVVDVSGTVVVVVAVVVVVVDDVVVDPGTVVEVVEDDDGGGVWAPAGPTAATLDNSATADSSPSRRGKKPIDPNRP